MISYELAKELKDAEFPQWSEEPRTGSRAFTGDAQVIEYDDGFWRNGEPVYYAPTLEELIEACGERFDFLNDRALPSKRYRAVGSMGESGTGSTPTEAVANLWLALNKKQ